MGEREEIRNLVEEIGLETDHLDLAETLYTAKDESGKVIGYVGTERRGNNVYLQSLVVDKANRRKGIGRGLVDAVYGFLNEGENLIALTLFWNNSFYQECGFTRLDAREIKATDDVAGRRKHKYCTAWGKKK